MGTCFEINIQNKMLSFDSAWCVQGEIFQLFSCMHSESKITFFNTCTSERLFIFVSGIVFNQHSLKKHQLKAVTLLGP